MLLLLLVAEGCSYVSVTDFTKIRRLNLRMNYKSTIKNTANRTSIVQLLV